MTMKKISLFIIFLMPVLYFLYNFQEIQERDKEIKYFFDQVFIKKNKKYFQNKLHSDIMKNSGRESHLLAFDAYFHEYPEIVHLKYSIISDSEFKFDARLEKSLLYLVKARTNKGQELEFTITFVKEDNAWCFYGYNKLNGQRVKSDNQKSHLE